MFSRRLLDLIRKYRCKEMSGKVPRPFSSEDFKPTNPSFFIRFDEASGQYKFE